MNVARNLTRPPPIATAVAPAVRPREPSARPRPLVVDLDHTLVRTDTLVESLVAVAVRKPLELPAILWSLRCGRSAFKSRLAESAEIDHASLPYDEAVLEHIAARRSQGSDVHLVTAANQSIADGVADWLGVFTSATGSSADRNLKGSVKAGYLLERFPGGFDYIGDSAADTPVWRAAGHAIIAGERGRLPDQLRRADLPVTTLPRPVATPRTWVKALRLHQWSKNLLILVPLLLGQGFTDTALAARAVAAVILFGMIASGTYLINDLSDLNADRRHRSKRFRALPSGLIRLEVAAVLAVVLVVLGLVGSLLLHPLFGLTAMAYTVLTLLYSFRLKRLPLVDVTTIAGLFAVRIIAGMVVIDHPVSLWLVTFTLVLFLSLALAKRTAELVQAARDGIGAVKGRGYLPGDEPLTLALGIATAVVSIIVMVLYMQIEAMPTGLYLRHAPLLLIPIIVGLWVMRIWLLAHRGTLDDDPVVFAIRDRSSWLHAAVVVCLWALAVVPLPRWLPA